MSIIKIKDLPHTHEDSDILTIYNSTVINVSEIVQILNIVHSEPDSVPSKMLL